MAVCLLAGGAGAGDLALSGILGGKALLVVDNGPPQLVAVGKSTPEGVKLVAIEGETAAVEFGGKRHVLRLGARVVRQQSDGGDKPGVNALSRDEARKILARGLEATFKANERGEFFISGEINGGKVHFLVDTGATFVSIGRADALRLGIRFDDAASSVSQTAGGDVRVRRVMLDSVTVGGIRLLNVEGVVHEEQDLPFVLLGMSFLKNMEMRRKGDSLYLRKVL
ncbi:MAG: retroviral-like aspartic protease family protein [Azoarcus sp.]|jgi:aspartyl protease family protein|nr:retroviral-like aspartic protease family protein [Azoarcus sp.]